ncbi:hypothetical protein [Gilvibacter sediminis]|uniref:hypothetical protein n=1 Tax=Gilvibacter sediminis TaxID=379071 RepID=UPI00234FBAE7|nr:hypothetical protein [Gilvibacter sediminis]MDC7996704.1 hypothetical protein [Gilvibacter sediminis]
MKKLVALFTLSLAVLTSCSTDNREDYISLDAPSFEVNAKRLAVTTAAQANTRTCASAKLWAAQTQVAGTLTISTDDTSIFVKYETTSEWVIDATHLFVGSLGDMPITPSGNPRVGHFPYTQTHAMGTNVVEYVIPIDAVPDCFSVAAHSVVTKLNDAGNPIYCETSWSDGTPVGGSNWAMTTTFCKSGCTSSTTDGPVRVGR